MRTAAAALAAAFLASPGRAFAARADWPAGAEVAVVATFKNLPRDVRSSRFALGVDEAGRPVLQAGDMFLPVRPRPGEEARRPFRAKSEVTGFAFLGDGSLVIVSGAALVTLTEEGPRTLLNLPEPGMKVSPFAGRWALLWGRRAVYLYRPELPSAPASLWLNVPGGVEALSANQDSAVFTSAGALYAYRPGKPPAAVAALRGRALSVALAPSGAVFYSDDDGVHYLSAAGRYRFSRERGVELAVGGDGLYLLFPGEGVTRAGPLSAFEARARAAAPALESPAQKR